MTLGGWGWTGFSRRGLRSVLDNIWRVDDPAGEATCQVVRSRTVSALDL